MPAHRPAPPVPAHRSDGGASLEVIYLDHHATTPCDPRVVEAMLPCFRDDFGNPASRQHPVGQRAARRVELARDQVAALLAADPREIVFTSGATESNNLALLGTVRRSRQQRGADWRPHVVTAVTEHKAVLDVCTRLEREGCDVTYLGIEADGRVRPEAVAGAIRDETVLVSLMLANNEIGVVHPIAEISTICRDRGVLLHCDAAQALSHLDCDVDRLGVDLLSLSAHKAYGPKGVGALFVRRRRPRVRLDAQMLGGGHESGRRSGTLNVPGIVGLGRACVLVARSRESEGVRLSELRDRMLSRLRQAFPELVVHGSLEHRLPNNLAIALPGLDAERLLQKPFGVAVSSGAACSSASHDGSYVLKALPGAADLAESSLRLGLGRETTVLDVETAADRLIAAITALEPRSPESETELVCGASCAAGMA